MSFATIAVKQNFSNASLYVGDLDPSVNEAILHEHFGTIGPVDSVRICRDAITKQSLRYAYVNYQSVDDAIRAINILNHKEINGRCIRVAASQRDPAIRKANLGNVFIKNLPKHTDHKLLNDAFSIFGNILSSKVATNRETGEFLNYGFVHFEKEEDAKTAIAKFSGKKLVLNQNEADATIITIQPYKSKSERSSVRFTNIYVKNLPTSWDNDQLKKFFSKFGSVTSAVIVRDEQGNSKGFGFVNMNNHEEAIAAIEGAHNADVNGEGAPKLFACRHQKKADRSKEKEVERERKRAERLKQTMDCNIYVKNISHDLDDNGLRELFSKFGTITSVRVMRTDKKDGSDEKKDGVSTSRGFGFVCFSTPDEASQAISKMNGQIIDNKPLYVTLAQSKDARRLMLEVQHRNPAYQYPVPQMYRAYPQGGFPQTRMVMQPMNNAYHLMPMNGGRPQQRYNGQQPQQRGAGRPMNQHMMRGPAARMNNGPRMPGMQQHRMPHSMPIEQYPPQDITQVDVQTFVKILQDVQYEEEKRRMIGERLYPLVDKIDPTNAPKITGMLLEMEIGEILTFFENEAELLEKVNEARAVLNESSA